MKADQLLKDAGKKSASSVLASRIQVLLKRKGGMTMAELSSACDRGAKQIEKAIEELQGGGYQIHLREDRAELIREVSPGGFHRIDPAIFHGYKIRFGFCGDSHLASKYAREDALNIQYDLYEEEKVPVVFHGGNLIDGECRFNQFDLIARGMEAQIAYAAKNYPRRKGVKTKFICGDDHEGWYAQREGVNIGQVMQDRFLQAGRDDLEYIGYLESDVLIPSPKQGSRGTHIRVMHPGGGSAYAISYAAQKLTESFGGGEKPDILLIGHYHKMDLCLPREVWALQGGAFQDQTPFMRKNKLQSHVGGWICEATQAPDGHVSRFRAEFTHFFDRQFYVGKEKFPRW